MAFTFLCSGMCLVYVLSSSMVLTFAPCIVRISFLRSYGMMNLSGICKGVKNAPFYWPQWVPWSRLRSRQQVPVPQAAVHSTAACRCLYFHGYHTVVLRRTRQRDSLDGVRLRWCGERGHRGLVFLGRRGWQLVVGFSFLLDDFHRIFES